jgi:hypothetical protein
MSCESGDDRELLIEDDDDDDVASKQTFHVGENTYETVEFNSGSTRRNIVIQNNGSRKCLVAMCLLIFFTLILSVSVGIIAFPIEIEKMRAEIDDLEAMVSDNVLGKCETFPVRSCTFLPPSFPSGYYWVVDLNGSAMHVFCEMELSCGGITGGWTRVTKLDMTNSSHQCPSGLRQQVDSNTRSCVNEFKNPGCSSTTYEIDHGLYSKMCGKVIAYQFGTTNAFGGTRSQGINSDYVDGVSITHGYPRSHIWTFAAALDEGVTQPASSYCPCINTSDAVRRVRPPSFVGNNYFCDTGGQYIYHHDHMLYSANPLWDGAKCGRKSTCCSFNSPPWFHRELSGPTSDDVEMRVCRNEDSQDEDIAIEMVEIYVQ